jgi:hypothetical protein
MLTKRILRSWAIGIGIDICLLITQNAGIAPPSLEKLSVPGLFLASALRFGSHDVGALLVTILTDGIEFGSVVLLLDYLITKRKPVENRER